MRSSLPALKSKWMQFIQHSNLYPTLILSYICAAKIKPMYHDNWRPKTMLTSSYKQVDWNHLQEIITDWVMLTSKGLANVSITAKPCRKVMHTASLHFSSIKFDSYLWKSQCTNWGRCMLPIDLPIGSWCSRQWWIFQSLQFRTPPQLGATRQTTVQAPFPNWQSILEDKMQHHLIVCDQINMHLH